jgi:ATP/maltotriose-dependent transcriptional regulator MalT
MTMTFSIHESIQPDGALDLGIGEASTNRIPDGFTLVREKLRVPVSERIVPRPRLSAMVRRSQQLYPATLITGRSGMGKTVIAAEFASKFRDVAWFSVEGNDKDWRSFARYFAASLGRTVSIELTERPTQNDIAGFLAGLFCDPSETCTDVHPLIVLDDIHHLFDAGWFEGFFTLLLYSLPASSHLLLLSRTRPPGPLWRMRSKQILNVLDEKVIAFDVPETEALFRSLGLAPEDAEFAQRTAFGRIVKLIGPA